MCKFHKCLDHLIEPRETKKHQVKVSKQKAHLDWPSCGRCRAAKVPKVKLWRLLGKVTPSRLWLKSCPKDNVFRLPQTPRVEGCLWCLFVFTKKASLLHQERTVFNLYCHMGSDPRWGTNGTNGTTDGDSHTTEPSDVPMSSEFPSTTGPSALGKGSPPSGWLKQKPKLKCSRPFGQFRHAILWSKL